MVSDMSTQETAEKLLEALEGVPGVQSVGIGRHDDEAALFVYASRSGIREVDAIGDRWHGFPVIVRRVGLIAPLA